MTWAVATVKGEKAVEVIVVGVDTAGLEDSTEDT